MKKQIIIITIIGGVILVCIGILVLINKQKSQSMTATNNPISNNGSLFSSPVPNNPSPSLPPVITVTTDDHTHDLEMKYQNKTEPDIFLSNNLPYQTTDFAASAAFTSSPTDHFYFIVLVISGNPDVTKQKFLAWVQSLGITQQQISQLDIRYQSK